ncbi:hypothetical protein ACFLUV_00665 [Elusimicrobiota bacterium]
MSLIEQMANIGSEVERALNWKEKNKPDYSEKAFVRALELLELTLKDPKNRLRINEIVRAKEALIDFFWDSNQYNSSASSWKSYFLQFLSAVRNTY